MQLSKKCENCNTSFIPKKRTNKNLVTKTCSSKCRYELRSKGNTKTYICKNKHCGKLFSVSAKNADGFCSVMCRTISRSQRKYTGNEGIDYIVCPLCHLRTKQFNPAHAEMHGFISLKDMQQQLNLSKMMCESKKMKGSNNPGYQHGGKFSHFSKNFINGYNEEKHLKVINENRERNITYPELFKTNIAYWLVEANGDAELAQELYRKFQTRDLEWFIEKYGEDEGKVRHLAKTEKWMKSYKKCNFSKISQELFNEIMNRIQVDPSQVYYATFHRDDMKDYKNKEYILYVGDTYVRPDFIILNEKLIIEFDGEYWHDPEFKRQKNESINKERDRIRDEKIISYGYKILHVKEKEYKLNKEKIIQECIQFLKQ